MANDFIRRILATILAMVMTMLPNDALVKNKADYEFVIDPETEKTETVETENRTEKETETTEPNKEDVVEEHKTTVTYNPTEEDIKNKEENKKEEEKIKTPKVEETKPVVDNRDKVTMIDLNTFYLDNIVKPKDTKVRFVDAPISKQEMPYEFKEVEALLLNAIDKGNEKFEYVFSSYPENFTYIFTDNHLVFGYYKAILFSSINRQPDGSYFFSVSLSDARDSIARAKTYNEMIKKENEYYKGKIYESVLAAGITEGMAVEDAVIKIHDYICEITEYDHTHSHYFISDIFDSGQSVCNGYANLFFMMAQRCGIDCKMVYSKNIDHIWNVVRFDGKELYIDVSYNDAWGIRDALLVSKEKLAVTHNFSDAVYLDRNTYFLP